MAFVRVVTGPTTRPQTRLATNDYLMKKHVKQAGVVRQKRELDEYDETDS